MTHHSFPLLHKGGLVSVCFELAANLRNRGFIAYDRLVKLHLFAIKALAKRGGGHQRQFCQTKWVKLNCQFTLCKECLLLETWNRSARGSGDCKFSPRLSLRLASYCCPYPNSSNVLAEMRGSSHRLAQWIVMRSVLGWQTDLGRVMIYLKQLTFSRTWSKTVMRQKQLNMKCFYRPYLK